MIGFRDELTVFNKSTLNTWGDPTEQTVYKRSASDVRCEDFTPEHYSYYFWLTEKKTEAVLSVGFNTYASTGCAFPTGLCTSNAYTVGVRLVHPTLEYETPDSQCAIQRGYTQCGVVFTWSKHYWAPGSAVYYRPIGGTDSDWQHLMWLGVSAGSIDLPPFASQDGAEFAVFQYSPGQPGISSMRPEGLLSDIFTVYGVLETFPDYLGSPVFSWGTNQDQDPNSWWVEDAGQTLNLFGNTWKAINYPYDITQNTWLEFDYRSSGDSPEIAGFYFPTRGYSLSQSYSARTLQIDGTEDYGNQWFHDYAGSDWKTYRINIGRLFTGYTSYMAFYGDTDQLGQAIDIRYRNPRLFEQATRHTPHWGHSGNWYETEKPGQGFSIEVNPVNDFIAIEWFTYDIDAQGEGPNKQRWYMHSSGYSETDRDISFDILRVVGGKFNNSKSVTEKDVGDAKIRFIDCKTAVFEYAFSDINDRKNGFIPLTRLGPNIDCPIDPYEGAYANDFGLTGNWWNPATSGQGFFLEAMPSIGVFAAEWFTYLPNPKTNGPTDTRWFVLVGPYTPGDPSSNELTIYFNTGGALDDPWPVQEQAVGTANIEFHSCTTATIYFQFTSGEFAGITDSIELQRLGSNVTCQ